MKVSARLSSLWNRLSIKQPTFSQKFHSRVFGALRFGCVFDCVGYMYLATRSAVTEDHMSSLAYGFIAIALLVGYALLTNEQRKINGTK